jgi:hypothetical protein
LRSSTKTEYKEYKIPRGKERVFYFVIVLNFFNLFQLIKGGLFEYVSAANYFGESVEWLGFALASWSLPALAFSLFTWANTGPRAYHHHL